MSEKVSCLKCGNPGPGWHICISPDKPLNVTKPAAKKAAPRPSGARTKPVAQLTDEQIARRRATDNAYRKRQREAKGYQCVEEGCTESIPPRRKRCDEHRRLRNNEMHRAINAKQRAKRKATETPEQRAKRLAKQSEYDKRYKEKRKAS